VDSRAITELETLDECSGRNVASYNELGEEGEGAADLLVAALGCFEEAGRSAQSIKLLRHLLERFPERAESEDARYRLREHYRTLAHERRGADTLMGRACGATVFDPPPAATAEALIEVAACVEQEAMFAMSLRYRKLAAERGPEPDNAANIERLEQRVVELEAAILELPSDPPRASSTGESFTCSMHPEIHQREPGTCPICGMDLIERHSGRVEASPDGPRDHAPPNSAR